MVEHEENYRDIENILKKQRAPKVPDGLLSNFTEEVLSRVEKKRRGGLPFAPLATCAFAVLLAGSTAALYFGLRPHAEETGARPAPAAAATAVSTIPAQLIHVIKQADADLPINDELRLLEEIAEDPSIFEGILSDEDLIRQELSVMAPRRI